MNAFARKLAFLGGGAVLGWSLASAVLRSARWFEFKNKVCVVTGGSRGLGLEIARRLAARGATVAICARTEADVRAAEQELRQYGGQVLASVCDLTIPDDVKLFAEHVASEVGRIDVLINVAGIIRPPSQHSTNQQPPLTTKCAPARRPAATDRPALPDNGRDVDQIHLPPIPAMR